MHTAQHTVEAYFRLFEAGDAVGLAQLFTDDGAIIAAGMETTRGAQEIESTFKSLFTSINMRCEELTVDRLVETGDSALAETRSTEKITNLRDKSTTTAKYRELFGLRRAGDDWKIVSYMFNGQPD